jgi:ribonuclease P protein component
LALQTGQPSSRLGLAISKKQIRRAVDRNRLKRHIRESFRRHRKQLMGLDLVVMARPAAGLADKKQLNTSLAELMRKLFSGSVR